MTWASVGGAYELIECVYPELPKIELFARHARPGWDAWGNEIRCMKLTARHGDQ